MSRPTMRTAVASWRAACRWRLRRSVRTAELPVVRPPCVGGLDDPAQPEREPVRFPGWGLGAASLDVEIVEPAVVQSGADRGIVVAAIEGDRVDVEVQPGRRDSVQGGVQHGDVVAVGAVDRPTDRDPGTLRCHGPLPAEFAPVNRALAGTLTAAGSLVDAAVDGHDVEIEFDDPVVGGSGLSFELVEYSGFDPLVAAHPQGRVGDLEVHHRFDVDPRGAGDEPNQQPAETDPVR